ncbi:hypothetical protein LWC34_21980 [Kibdelosporangium philippinense]|uniref:Uncharacterized protein n=1 Tax=Kibdelosporangium philippinense TaxID=211113 RepID=A0ABS8ZFM1_9PSEU|nr:hypothetical protein [Kibdelosporangium philippinense]MCE7005471.1 hypothetical protein [Kibdelosporangium philippinense]
MNTLINPPAGPSLDLATVVTVLYVSPFTPADWDRVGPARLAAFVTATVADPRCRVPELVALLTAACAVGNLPPVARAHLAAAQRHAPRVLAALTN